MTEHEDEGYQGTARLLRDGEADLDVEVTLRGLFQPIDGRYHWYGRIKANDEVTSRVEAGARTALLRTPTGQAEGTLTDQDPWGRYRVSGVSTPPYKIEEPVEN